jgi:hypothetical protein
VWGRCEVYTVWWGNLKEDPRLDGRIIFRWENNIKMELQEVMVWTELIWLRIGKAGQHFL